MSLDILPNAARTDLGLTTGIPAAIALLEAGLRIWQGTWFADTREGVPWVQDLSARPDVIRADVYRVAIATPGVAAVRRIGLRRDAATRTLAIDLAVEIAGSVYETTTERPYG